MNTATLTHGQRALLETDLRLRLAQAVKRSLDHRDGLSSVDHAHELVAEGPDDAPQREDSIAVDQALNDRDRVVQRELAQALSRVHAADFGLCRACGVQIPFDRLKIEPWAERCMPCQSEAERSGSA